MKDGLTDIAGKFLMDIIENGNQDGKNPFVYRDNKLFMLFDSMQIKNSTLIHNSMERNTSCVNVCYYWKNVLMTVTLVQNIGLDTNQVLYLDGFEGAMGVNNKDQFTMKNSELEVHIDSVKGHLECMTDKQLEVMRAESEGYPDDNVFKIAIVEELNERINERGEGSGN